MNKLVMRRAFMLELDGSHEEGGGQIVRTALALSCLTNKPFRVINIRKGREKPGLKQQHLTAIKFLQQITNAYVSDVELGSEEFTFYPRTYKLKSSYDIDITTAGSITLLLQSILPFLGMQQKKIILRIKGGTDVAWSMQIAYFTNIFLPAIRRAVNCECNVLKRGYYPKGQGEIELTILPTDAMPIVIHERGELQYIKGISHASQDLQSASVAERQVEPAAFLLKGKAPVSMDSSYHETASTGSGLLLYAQYEHSRMGVSILGERSVKAQNIGTQLANSLMDLMSKRGAIDEHLGDNLIPFLAISGGSIIPTTITAHTRANMYVCEKFLPIKFVIENNTITVEQVASQS